MSRVVEIRSYALKPGTGAAFHALVLEGSIPMLARWKVDVVACGPSLHDDQAYVLIRAYDDLGERQASQDAFYGSAEWKEGPRDALLAMIESYTTVVLNMDEAAIEALRTAGSRGFPLSEGHVKRDLSWLFFLAAALFLVAGFMPLLRDQRVNTVFVALAAFWTILGLATRKRGASGGAAGEEHGRGDS